jgi:hypothetical protein
MGKELVPGVQVLGKPSVVEGDAALHPIIPSPPPYMLGDE